MLNTTDKFTFKNYFPSHNISFSRTFLKPKQPFIKKLCDVNLKLLHIPTSTIWNYICNHSQSKLALFSKLTQTPQLNGTLVNLYKVCAIVVYFHLEPNKLSLLILHSLFHQHMLQTNKALPNFQPMFFFYCAYTFWLWSHLLENLELTRIIS